MLCYMLFQYAVENQLGPVFGLRSCPPLTCPAHHHTITYPLLACTAWLKLTLLECVHMQIAGPSIYRAYVDGTPNALMSLAATEIFRA